jgi:HlyD family secretion protein
MESEVDAMKTKLLKPRFLFRLLVIAASAFGVGILLLQLSGESAEAPRIQTQPLSLGSVVETVDTSGTLEAVTTVQVGTQVSGNVQALYADFNSIVRRGQLLARLDPSLLETQREQAAANLVRAEADMERLMVSLSDTETKVRRAEELWARRLIPESELESAKVSYRSAAAQVRSAEAQITQARAGLNQVEVNLQKTVITAPIDGIVVARNVDVGQTVASSLQTPTLFLLAEDLSRMRVNANVDESDIGRIRPGQQVLFRVDAFTGEQFPGTVAQVRLQPTVVQNVVSYSVLIDVPNSQLKLRPGMTATVTIEVARRDNVLRVPNAALRFRPSDAVRNLVPVAAEEQPQPVRRGGVTSPTVVRASLDTGTLADARTANSTSMAAVAARALFEPIEAEEHEGRVWVMEGDTLRAIPVRLGLSDGSFTELRGQGLTEGTEVVTDVRTSTGTTTRTTSGSSSPLMPSGPGGPGGGFR